jgi:glutathione S-transferase
MKLYYAPAACSLSPHIVAREANADVTIEKVDLKTKKTESGKDFAAINPKGYVPALELDDGRLLTEGAVIVQYLADKTPASRLAPQPGTIERYQVQEWLNYIATELHKAWGPLFNAATPDDRKASIKEQLATRFKVLGAQLERGPFLMGETFSVADAYLFTVLNWSKFTNVDLPDFLKRYLERVGARPAVQAAMKEEGLLS